MPTKQTSQTQKFKAIFYKEFSEFFATKFSWIFLTTFIFALGALSFYAGDLFNKNLADAKPFFIYQSYLFIFFLPILTMNIWQKERSQKSLELLLTLGVKNLNLVLAKFSFLFILLIIMLILTIPVFLSLVFLGNIETRMALSAYLGCFLLGATYLSIGQFASFIMRNQASAFLFSLTIILLFSATSLEKLRYFFIEIQSQMTSFKILKFSFSENFLNFVNGSLSAGSIVFFLSAISIFLALNTFALNFDKFKH